MLWQPRVAGLKAVAVAACLAAGALLSVAGSGAAVRGQAEPISPAGTIPVVAEHRYRMSAKIRPLLVFWIGRDNVGAARIRWRRGEGGARGLDVLIGSDPARAPRQINRWGYILEEVKGADATVVGVMKRSDEDTLDAAKAGVANEGKEGFFFKMIQGQSNARESTSKVTITRVDRDYSYRDLDALLEALIRFPGPPRIRMVAVPPGGRAGFLTALADLLQDAVARVAAGRTPGAKGLSYAYYGKQYDVRRLSATTLTNATFGGRAYPRLLQAEFELRARGDPSKDAFTIACGLDGPLAGVPVYIAYQPKWWFKAELVLDERESF